MCQECVVLTLRQQLGDCLTVVLGVVTLFSSQLLIGCLHALFKQQKTDQSIHKQRGH